MKRMIALSLSALMLTSVAFAGAGTKTIAQIAASNPNFSTLVTALKRAKLVKVLNGKGNFTVFAPTNKAFAKLPKATLDNLLAHPAKLKPILLYHVVGQRITANMIEHNGYVKTLEGQKLHDQKIQGKVYINNVKVTQADIHASNGIIHVIGSVLIPPHK